MESNVEEKIIAYESNILKQAFFDKEAFIYLLERIPDKFFHLLQNWLPVLFVRVHLLVTPQAQRDEVVGFVRAALRAIDDVMLLQGVGSTA
jgi:hypothetical protein